MVVLAFSVHHFIASVGADAGFAAIVGLAILVLLYFAQARESATLRDEARESAQRLQQLEGRLAELARAPAPAPMQAAESPSAVPAPASAAANPVASAMPASPGAPAGMAAPALTAATRLISGQEARAAQPGDDQGDAEAASTGDPARPGPHTAAARESAEGPGDITTFAPPPASAAATGNGNPAPVVGPPRQPPERSDIRSAAPVAPVRRAPTRRPAPRRVEEPPSRARRLLPVLIAVVAVVAVVLALLALTSGGASSNQRRAGAGPASNAQAAHPRRPAPKPAPVNVAVLNGTATSGLAHRVAVKLTAAGYKQGTIATATDQTRTATVVAYMPSHKRDALAIASALKLGPASVQPVDANTQAVACPPPSPCQAAVVVTVGSDLAGTQ